MADGPEPLCFTCGLPFGNATRLNHLPSGQVCPSCRDRLLEALPAPFPTGPRRAAADSYDEPEPAPVHEPVRQFVRLPRSKPPRDHDPEPA